MMKALLPNQVSHTYDEGEEDSDYQEDSDDEEDSDEDDDGNDKE